MGTYSAGLTVFSTSGSVVANPISPPSHGLDGLTDTSGSGSIVQTFTGNFISLDGNPAIAFTGLPAGFEFLTVSVGKSHSPFGFIGALLSSPTGGGSTASCITSWGVYGPLTTTAPQDGNTHDINFPNVVTPKVIDFLSSVHFDLTALDPGLVFYEAAAWDDLKATGNYDIYFSITPASSTVARKMRITLTAPNKLDLLQEVKTYDNSGNFLGDATISNQSATSITLTIPDTGYLGAATLVGIEFGGRTYILQPLTIILSNPAGIYQIVAGKTNDTLYLDHTTVTQDVAIPSPFIKTGFIDGE